MSNPFAALLKLQELDIKIQQNKYELENFPEIQELEEVKAAHSKLQKKLEAEESKLAENRRNQKTHEDQVATIEDKKATYQEQLSEITAPKDLQNLETAVAGQNEQQSTLEDEILVLMEEADLISASIQELESQRSEEAKKMEQLEARLANASGKTTKTLETQKQDREKIASTLSDEIIEKYEKMVIHQQGIAVAELIDDKCHGCDLNMTHPVSEIERLKNTPPEEFPHCGECQRILIIH